MPGFPELTLEADNGGWGTSRLVWSRESRQLSRPAHESYDLNLSNEYELEYNSKIIEGIGYGFSVEPELIIIPNSDNISKTKPNIVTALSYSLSPNIDGSIALQIVDDENTSRYYPGDKFTVRFSLSCRRAGLFLRAIFIQNQTRVLIPEFLLLGDMMQVKRIVLVMSLHPDSSFSQMMAMVRCPLKLLFPQ